VQSHNYLEASAVGKIVSQSSVCIQYSPIQSNFHLNTAISRTERQQVLKTKGCFPNEESVYKLLYLALNNIAKKWTMPIRDWKAALMRFAIEFPDRFPQF
jgi:transposase-like protein